jgi:hypothetical protein
MVGFKYGFGTGEVQPPNPSRESYPSRRAPGAAANPQGGAGYRAFNPRTSLTEGVPVSKNPYRARVDTYTSEPPPAAAVGRKSGVHGHA